MSDTQPCSVCGATPELEEITYTRRFDGRVYIVTGVPARGCPQCGEEYLSPDTVDTLQRIIESGQAPEVVEVPPFRFPRATPPKQATPA